MSARQPRNGPVADLRAEAMSLWRAAFEQNVTLRAVGGVAVSIRCPSVQLVTG